MLWHHSLKEKGFLPFVYLAAFFLSFHSAMTLYVNSSFLSQFLPEEKFSALYAFCAILIMWSLAHASKALRKFGAYSTTIVLIILETLASAFLSVTTHPGTAIALFALHYVVISHLFYNFDIFTEEKSTAETVGETRGIFLTVINFAVLCGPLAAGFILQNGQNYGKLYFASAVIMLPILLIALFEFKDFRDPPYIETKWREALSKIIADKNLFSISCASFLLQFFYAWMVIYAPIYLHTDMGFSWEQIGYILAVALLPFVILELPLGEIADHYIGEKEILFGGFLFTAIMTASLSFVASKNAAVWAILLFCTRVGAASVEGMTEIYFFKKITAADSDALGLFRYAAPLALILGPIAAFVFLLFFPMRLMFLALGALMLAGLYFAIKIEDTK